MVNELLINLVNSVLGVGKRTSKGNQAYHCPFCNHHKPKLEINFTENKEGINPWNCWVCNTKGKKLYYLFKKLKAHYKKHGYGVRKRKKGNPMWGTDPKRLKENQE